MAQLTPVIEAQARMLAAVTVLERNLVTLEHACGRVLFDDVISHIDLPPFSNSSMDGFAVKAADLTMASRENPKTLKIVADIPAGTIIAHLYLKEREAARIMTGAALPPGADTVVPVEDTSHFQVQETRGNVVEIFTSPEVGSSVRFAGQDIHSGQKILAAGTRLRPQDVGMLATLGIAQVSVYRQPRVAFITSGDELVSPGKALGPGQVYDSNSYTLSALIKQSGAELVSLGIVPDEEEKVRTLLDQAAESAVDLIITSAGVSVGEYDFVRKVIEQNGKINFWRVNMRPGKPIAFGTYKGIPIIGLPGNPVSAFVGFTVFALPVLRRMSGLPDQSRRLLQAILTEDIESDGRESYLRAKLTYQEGQWRAGLTGHQGSGNLFSLVTADALMIIPAGVTHLTAGSPVSIWMLE